MGSSGNQQQLVGQQKAQKGWLSRWTRKQWSRHWFVLKNGSLTYYRGPAAELCSFLDGVLDLSLIKHIEVPQQEEQVVLGHQHLNHHHQNYHHQNYHHLSHHQINPSPLVNFNGASQQQQPQHNHHQQQQQHLQQHQEHQQQHFNFSLKMWNGECHLLSASSASERQLWLAAINSCNNYDDETASSDSSSSSQSSNISTKSADIGSSHHSSSCLVVPTALHQPSLPLTPSSPSPPAAAAQLITTNNRETANRTSLANTEPSLTYQQKLDKEAEASLEQFALKLKSVVRRRRDVDNDPMDPTDGFQEQAPQQEQQQQATKQQASLITRQHPMNPSQKSLNSNQSNPTSQHQQQHTKQVPAIQAKGNLTIEKPKTDLICLDGQLEPANKEHANEKEQVEEDEEQAHKRRLVCLHSPTSDLATGGQIVQVNESEKLSLGTTALNTASDESPERAEVEVEMRCLEETEEAEKTEDEEEEDNDDELSDEGGESSLSDCDDHSMDSSLYCRPRKLESTIGSCRTPSDLNQGPPEVGQQQQQQQQRQKKRVTFDLSNQNIKSIPAATSSDDEEDDQEDKARDNDDNDEDEDDEEDEEDDDETTTTLSSASGSNSEGDDEDDEKEEDENDEDDNETEPRISSNCANSRVLLPTEGETLVPGSPGGSVDTERRHLLESAGIKRIEMRRRLELREQLRYSKQKSSYEDEDSTCELVRRMIERRKLRLQNKDGAVVGGKGTKECNNNNKENESSAANICQSGGAISSTKMETNQDDDEHNDPLAVVSVSVPPVSTKQTNQHDMNMNLNSLINQTDLLTKQLELEMRLKSAESNADLLEKRLNDSYLSYSQLEMSYKQLQLELNECRELNAKNMAQMQNKIDELTSKLKLSELELLEAKEKLLKHEQHLARWQLMNGNNQQQEQEAATASTQKPTLLTGTSQQQQQQQQQQNEQQKCNPIRSSNNWLTKNYSNSVLMSTSTSTSGNKLLMNLANSLNQQQQQATPSKVIHQMRQSHSMRQQQLGLKLLSTSKQIQRKLNELELKVDKIQNGTANNNNNQQMLIDLNHEQQHLATANDHRQTTVAADSSSSSSNMANNGE